MADKTNIEWTDWTYNPVRGCSRISPGCENCYAERQARRFDQPGFWAHGLTVIRGGRPGWSGKIDLATDVLDAPLRKRIGRRAFVCSGADLFHERVPFEYLAAVYGVMGTASQHTFQVLTKRIERAREFYAWLRDRAKESSEPPMEVCLRHAVALSDHRALRQRPGREMPWPPRNVGVGVSVEDQARADSRIQVLRECDAAWRFLSCEPLLERVTLDLRGLDWVIVGGESGQRARPCALEWIGEVVDACRAAQVACFVKQLGAFVVSEERASDTVADARSLCGDEKNDRWLWRAGLADVKGGDPYEWPDDLRVRMQPGEPWPAVQAAKAEQPSEIPF